MGKQRKGGGESPSPGQSPPHSGFGKLHGNVWLFIPGAMDWKGSRLMFRCGPPVFVVPRAWNWLEKEGFRR